MHTFKLKKIQMRGEKMWNFFVSGIAKLRPEDRERITSGGRGSCLHKSLQVAARGLVTARSKRLGKANPGGGTEGNERNVSSRIERQGLPDRKSVREPRGVRPVVSAWKNRDGPKPFQVSASQGWVLESGTLFLAAWPVEGASSTPVPSERGSV